MVGKVKLKSDVNMKLGDGSLYSKTLKSKREEAARLGRKKVTRLEHAWDTFMTKMHRIAHTLRTGEIVSNKRQVKQLSNSLKVLTIQAQHSLAQESLFNLGNQVKMLKDAAKEANGIIALLTKTSTNEGAIADVKGKLEELKAATRQLEQKRNEARQKQEPVLFMQSTMEELPVPAAEKVSVEPLVTPQLTPAAQVVPDKPPSPSVRTTQTLEEIPPPTEEAGIKLPTPHPPTPPTQAPAPAAEEVSVKRPATPRPSPPIPPRPPPLIIPKKAPTYRTKEIPLPPTRDTVETFNAMRRQKAVSFLKEGLAECKKIPYTGVYDRLLEKLKIDPDFDSNRSDEEFRQWEKGVLAVFKEYIGIEPSLIKMKYDPMAKISAYQELLSQRRDKLSQQKGVIARILEEYCEKTHLQLGQMLRPLSSHQKRKIERGVIEEVTGPVDQRIEEGETSYDKLREALLATEGNRGSMTWIPEIAGWPSWEVRSRNMIEEQQRLTNKVESILAEHPELKETWEKAKEEFNRKFNDLRAYLKARYQHEMIEERTEWLEGSLQLLDELRETMGIDVDDSELGSPRFLERYQKTKNVQEKIDMLRDPPFTHHQRLVGDELSLFNKSLQQLLYTVSRRSDVRSFRDLNRTELNAWVDGAEKIVARQRR